MRRVAAVLFLLAGVILIGTRGSHAQQITVIQGHCFEGPNYTLVACPTAAPPTAVPVTPTKNLSVSGPEAGPLGTSNYTINITSQDACFPLGEPIYLFTLGNSGEAIVRPVSPLSLVAQNPFVQNVTVDASGNATLAMEVLNMGVGSNGLYVKAVWPQEAIDRIVPIFTAVPPTATATLAPGQATTTPTVTSTPVPTSTAIPTTTGTPGTPVTVPATAVPTSTPGPFFVSACVLPSAMVSGTVATLYGRTVAGAICTASVAYSDGTVPPDFTGSAETAGNDGLVAWSWNATTTAGGGTANVSCTFNETSGASSAPFTVVQPGTPVPTAVP